MTNIFKIKREEWPSALLVFAVVATLNVLLVSSYPDSFFRAGKIGAYSTFHPNFTLSGYDEFSYMFIARMKIYYELLRHPLYGVVLWPLYWLNQGLMVLFKHNFTVYLMSALETLCATWSAVFLHRICRELVGVGVWDARLLVLLLFSFGHVLAASVAPDHFGLSMTCLLATAYVVGTCFKSGKLLSAWQTFWLFFITAGMSPSNGVKVGLSALFANGKKVFRPKYLLVGFIVPLILLGGLVYWQHAAILVPQKQEADRIVAIQKKKHPEMFEKMKPHQKWVRDHAPKTMAKSGVLKWTDISTSRWTTLTNNVFGESIQIHQKHLLEDLAFSRPVFLDYDWAVNYVVEVLVLLLLVVGIVSGLDQKLLYMLLSWVGFGACLHLLLGFGINEIYIMSSHWLFLIPIAVGFALVRCVRPLARCIRAATCLLMLYLWAYNGWLLVTYLLHPITRS